MLGEMRTFGEKVTSNNVHLSDLLEEFQGQRVRVTVPRRGTNSAQLPGRGVPVVCPWLTFSTICLLCEELCFWNITHRSKLFILSKVGKLFLDGPYKKTFLSEVYITQDKMHLDANSNKCYIRCFSVYSKKVKNWNYMWLRLVMHSKRQIL